MKKTLLAMILAVISSMVMAKSEAEQFGLPNFGHGISDYLLTA